MRTNERGNRIQDAFVGDMTRYHYDSRVCRESDGWQQYDTDQDASYFGVWVHTIDRVILTYAEGDESIVTCPTRESFAAELASMAEFYGPPPPAFTVISADGITKHYDERPGTEDR